MTAIPTKPTMSVLLIADSDSQLLACEALCTAPTTLNVHWTINVIPRDGTPQALLQRLAQRATLRRHSLAQLLRDRGLLSVDAIGVFLTGSKLNDIASRCNGSASAPFCSVVSTAWCWTTSSKVSWRLATT